jgi:hypothetical protein
MKTTPEKIMEHYVHTESGLFLDFLHENYIHFFADSSDELAAAADAFSNADLIASSKWATSGGGGSNSMASEHAALVGMYGVMYANTHRVPRSFHQFSKPGYSSAVREQRHQQDVLDLIFRSKRHATEFMSLGGGNGAMRLLSARDVATETAPFVRHLIASPRFSRSPFSPSEVEFIRTLCTYSQTTMMANSSSSSWSRGGGGGGGRKALTTTSTETVDEILNEGKSRERDRAMAITRNILTSDASSPTSGSLPAGVVAGAPPLGPESFGDDIVDD